MSLFMNDYSLPLDHPKPQRTPRRIFIADDDEDTLQAIVSALLEDGHEVFAVEGGDEILEFLDIIATESLRGPDLIAMDVHMPGSSGIDILENIRFAGWTTPVILFTSFATDALRARADAAGAALVLEKPRHLRRLRRSALRGDLG